MPTDLERQRILSQNIDKYFEQAYLQLLADTKARKAVNNNLTGPALKRYQGD